MIEVVNADMETVGMATFPLHHNKYNPILCTRSRCSRVNDK